MTCEQTLAKTDNVLKPNAIFAICRLVFQAKNATAFVPGHFRCGGTTLCELLRPVGLPASTTKNRGINATNQTDIH